MQTFAVMVKLFLRGSMDIEKIAIETVIDVIEIKTQALFFKTQ